MRPNEAKSLGALLKAKREELGISTHKLASLAGIDQATVVRFEAGTILAPHPDKLTRVASALGLSAADVYGHAGYLVPGDLPSLRPYLESKYPQLLQEDVEKIEQLFYRLVKKRQLRPDGPNS